MTTKFRQKKATTTLFKTKVDDDLNNLEGYRLVIF